MRRQVKKAIEIGMPLYKSGTNAVGSAAVHNPATDSIESGTIADRNRKTEALRATLRREAFKQISAGVTRESGGPSRNIAAFGHSSGSGRSTGENLPHSPAALEDEIGPALKNGQFELFLQPQIDLQHFTIAGAEALLRWRHPERGLLTPAVFLPAAETSRQICDIGRWVRSTVCENFAAWRGWMGAGSIALNVSPAELLDSRFLPDTFSALAAHAIPDSGVELELVETAVLTNPELARETIQHLRRGGIRMALDDFGVGYSSLSSLRDYPFSKLKIDRSFVQSLVVSHRSRTIVRSMIELGRSLNIRVNAEGVETPEQLQYLFENGCHEVQGFLFARPMPVARFRDWVAGFQGRRQPDSADAASQAPSGTRPRNVLDFRRVL